MKPLFSRLVGKLKTLFDAYKMWIFFIALIGTNGGQQMYYHEPEAVEKPIVKPANKPAIIKQIIYKTDEAAVKRLIETELNKHYESSRH